MRIRFLNTYEPVSPTYRDLLPFLAERGVEVEVVVSSAEYRAGRACLEDTLNHPKIRISRTGSGWMRLTGSWQKLWIMLSYMFNGVGFTLFGRPVDLNVFLTQPPLFSLWGYVLKLIRRQAYYCLVMDIYPEVAIQAGVLRRGSLSARLLASLSCFALRKADAVIVIGRCMVGRMRAMGVCEDRIHFIPNWANEDELSPVADGDNPLRRELNLEGVFVVLYSGNMGLSHYFDDLLEVICRCRGMAGLRFVFVGDGVRRREIERARAEHDLENVLLLPYQPMERLGASLSLGDLHFISLREGFEGLVVPSKAYGALAVGRPILYQGNAEGEISCMVAEGGVGAVISNGQVDQLEQTIVRYYQDQVLAAEEGRRALELARGPCSYRHALEKYWTLFVGAKAAY